MFGTLSEETPLLADYIGNLWRADRPGAEVAGDLRHHLADPAQQWKLYVENVRDTYHATLLHTFFTTFRQPVTAACGGVPASEGGGNHTSYTRGKHDIVGQEGSDKLYADIQSMRDGVRLADPRLLDAIEEFGDDVTVQILSVFPNFVLQQINNSTALRLVLPKGAGGERAVVDLSRFRG